MFIRLSINLSLILSKAYSHPRLCKRQKVHPSSNTWNSNFKATENALLSITTSHIHSSFLLHEKLKILKMHMLLQVPFYYIASWNRAINFNSNYNMRFLNRVTYSISLSLFAFHLLVWYICDTTNCCAYISVYHEDIYVFFFSKYRHISLSTCLYVSPPLSHYWKSHWISDHLRLFKLVFNK